MDVDDAVGSALAPSDLFEKALGNPNSAVSIEYLKAGLSGLRIAPSAFGTAALALPVVMKVSELTVEFGWFVAGAALSLLGVLGLSGAAFFSAVGGSTVWARGRLVAISLGFTVLAAVALLLGVWIGTK